MNVTEIRRELLNRSVQCTCKKVHRVPIEMVTVGDNVAIDLISFLKGKLFRALLVVADVNTDEVFGADLRNRLSQAGFQVTAHIFSAEHDLLPDEDAITDIRNTLRTSQRPADVVLAVGSGVINDVVRYVSFDENLPFISVATAPSMDGYASGMAAMQFNGIKVTTLARPPIAIFAELRVLTESPFALIQSGFGDLVGKVTSLSDWVLASTLYGEYFCPRAFEIVYEPLEYVLSHPGKLRERDGDAVKNLFIGLINAGIAMALVGNSRPCSGSEHHCSHFWDLLAFTGLRSHTSHGLQVGYATHWTSSLYKYLLQHKDKLRPVSVPVPTTEETEDFIRYVEKFYGTSAGEIIATHREKARWFYNHQYVGPKVDLNTALKLMIPLIEDCKSALVTMDIPCSVGYLEIDLQTLSETLRHANELRSRFTIFDLLALQGWLEDAVAQVLKSAQGNDRI